MTKKSTAYQTNSPLETIKLGERIGKQLKAGQSVALVGDLGSGKTVLVKGIAKALGTNKSEHVSSPTFVMFHVYEGRIPLYHFDFYRLDENSDLEEIGVDDFVFDPSAVSVMEWANQVPRFLETSDIRIDFKVLGEGKRRIKMVKNDKKIE